MKSVVGAGIFQHFLSLSPAEFSHFNSNKNLNQFSRFQCNSSISFPSRLGPDSKHRGFLSSTLIPSASASSIGGSSADYSEQLLDAQRKQKRKRRIAGVDQDELVEPTVLADPDSCFCEFRGVQIHYKVYDGESQANGLLQTQATMSNQTKKVGLPMILLHGFGASVFSWNRVMKPLAGVTGSKVLAFDRPAFGLTSRVNLSELHSASGNGDSKPLNPYSMAFSVLATLYFIDSLAAEKAIIVGHSAGSLVAVNTYFEAPERVAALILVAPAILAPVTAPKVAKGNQVGRERQLEEENSSTNILGNPFIQLYNILSKFTKVVVDAIIGLVKGMAVMINSLYKKLLSSILRSAFAVTLVRTIIDKLGIPAVRNSWHDPNQVTEHIINGYTKPLRTKSWDRALVEFTAAMLTDTASESKGPLTKRLHEISCPVLIITGDNDRLVPSWNAVRLSRAIPGARLEVIKHCGHLPHEEKKDEFISVVQKFLQTVFGDSEEQRLQVVV
ncbi:hypothetical protein FEM48_Zijuj03G0121600 [Ziziphus jujuba var. spinosa]|uniref:AB hydrolase-1 domain-containing protein n=1 Tax=Ziziphus jujuba var. spinosa TaxID=714518 RepID=A0A978VQ83_ZIZJJ|nr:hypothetical protein FEM48_Zijuj03G0121600 [Ziziphus jujuba var. spinosa]